MVSNYDLPFLLQRTLVRCEAVRESSLSPPPPSESCDCLGDGGTGNSASDGNHLMVHSSSTVSVYFQDGKESNLIE